MWSVHQVDTIRHDTMVQHLNTMQQPWIHSKFPAHKAPLLPAKYQFLIQTGVRIPTECGAYIMLIQCSGLIQCNTCRYNAPFPNTLYRSLNQIAFLPAKHTVFRTFLASS